MMSATLLDMALDGLMHSAAFTAADWYNYRRCHSAPRNLPPVRNEGDPPVINLKKAKVVCESELGGHLKSCRAAA
jgi:hypothetical protein